LTYDYSLFINYLFYVKGKGEKDKTEFQMIKNRYLVDEELKNKKIPNNIDLAMLFLSSSGGGSSGGGGGGGGGSSSGGSGGGGISSWFGGKKEDPVELAKEWKRKLQKEMRAIDREITNIKRQEDRAMKECKALAKANRLPAAKVLAKEIARTRKMVERMYTAKAQLSSVTNNLQVSVCKSIFL
jgi:hypothetical protein